MNYQTVDDLEDELSQFRLEWKQELLQQQQDLRENKVSNKSENSNLNEENLENFNLKNEKKAEYLFNKGVLLEQQGRLYEAIKFYRMAMQLDKDIEFKVASIRKQTEQQTLLDDTKTSRNSLLSGKENINSVEENESLYERFQNMILSNEENNYQFCEKQFPQKVCFFFLFHSLSHNFNFINSNVGNSFFKLAF